MTNSNNSNQENTEISSFVKEVARYFMSFLETDFKKRRLPKRNTIQKSKNGLKVAIDLDKYDSLKTVLQNNLNRGFPKEDFTIKKGAYTTNIPKTLLELISRKINKLSTNDLKIVFLEIEKEIDELSALYKKEHDKFLEEATEITKKILARTFVLPFLDDLDKPLENLNLADENSKYQLEIDIVDALFSYFEINFLDLLQTYSQHGKTFNLKKELKKIILLPELKTNLLSFFETFAVGDAFYDLYQLFRNNKLIDKTELYLYFYEVSLGNEKFPVLYLPLSVEKRDLSFKLKFDNRLFINTKAIDFVVQEYNLQVKQKATLAGEFERIIYLNDQSSFQPQLETIIKKLEIFFELNRNIDVSDPQKQKGINLIVSLSNKSYFYLFDTSDESLINDYEEILNDDGDLLEKFNELLNSFIEENPTPFMEEVEDEWDDRNISNKLVIESPIPLNDEQKKVLMALEKPDCKFLVLEGPPGTGKSHTITAIICKALLEEKSVLVLSDKKEALDVVEEKISETLNKIRHEDDFQNPILRLGRSGNKFYKIVQGQIIAKIKAHYRTYKNKKDDYDSARKEIAENLKTSIQDNIHYFENISIEDIDYYFSKTDKYKDFVWISDENLSELEPALLKLIATLGNIGKFKNLLIKHEWLENDNLKSIQDLREILTNIKSIKLLTNKYSKKYFEEIERLSKPKYVQTKIKFEDLIFLTEKISESNPDNNINELFQSFDSKIVISELKENLDKYNLLINIYHEVKRTLDQMIVNEKILDQFIVPDEISIDSAIDALRLYSNELGSYKKLVIGYLFQKDKIISSTRKFKKTFHYFKIENPEKKLDYINNVLDLYERLKLKANNNGLVDSETRSVFRLLTKKQSFGDLPKFTEKTSGLISDLLKYESYSILDCSNFAKVVELFNLIDDAEKYVDFMGVFESLDINLTKNSLFKKDTSKIISRLDQFISDFELSLTLKDDLKFIKQFSQQFSKLAQLTNLKIDSTYINEITCELTNFTEDEIISYLKFIKTERKLDDQFNFEENNFYSDNINTLEHLVAAQMTYFLDKRIIEYSGNCAGEVQLLKSIIKKKQKFPKKLFKNLKKAFPCILAGVRDYAEYIPLEKDLFDLIIIDEASQVSIAQSLPALIRGKQVVVLGDDKQFSNVKANNASKVTNQELKNKVQKTFIAEKINGEDDQGWLTKVQENFDIKNSILKFMRFIRNYDCQLKKHFRCYPEIISYSDKYFYDGALQCMKVRGIPVKDVIKFDVIDHDGKIDQSKNTNELEIKFIIKKLKEFKDNNIEQSIGIITPHRGQVTLLFDRINELPERDWLFGKCKLKIMTFDTCQGEERDYIFYSMVATHEKDQLNWIFPVNFSSINDEIEGTVKSQRLNVGFSRAKECIHFVLSKKPEDFRGEIKNALLHYKNELEVSRKTKQGNVDPNSPMERKIRHYFYETQFYKDNKDKIEFISQFPLGEYLKQLNQDYSHPLYKVDFLLIYKNEKIIIEYDGFKEHFSETNETVNASNYKYYMNEGDIYRQKVLEGYGYKFLRLNKFNMSKDPVDSFDKKLNSIVKKKLKTQRF
ncbi:hypothetical protein KKE34_04540 [Patescibacteria group bacterium]|nr:hypothetical protein [Patescibacteria group bacterium]MBU1885844.1 hypothetical protein [Patescibacteria group bacterium]